MRLVHLIISMIGGHAPSSMDDVLCRTLNYCLTCSGHLVYWLSSLVALERVYLTVVISGQWFKKPSVARRLILCVMCIVLVS